MIVHVRGTNGSGKSTVVRDFWSKYKWEEIFVPRKRKPLFYFNHELSVAIVGHYDTTCGGTDVVGSPRKVIEALDEHNVFERFDHILYEGILVSEDVKWTLSLQERGFDILCLFLTTDIDLCVDRVRQRKEERAKEGKWLRSFDPNVLIKRQRPIDRAYQRLTEAGIRCLRRSGRQATQVLHKELGNA